MDKPETKKEGEGEGGRGEDRLIFSSNATGTFTALTTSPKLAHQFTCLFISLHVYVMYIHVHVDARKTDLFIPLLNSKSFSPLGILNTRITVPCTPNQADIIYTNTKSQPRAFLPTIILCCTHGSQLFCLT